MGVRLPNRVIVSEAVWESPLAIALRANLPPDIPVLRIGEYDDQPQSFSPKLLEVINFRGRFLRSCPATRFYHCCGYVILHFGEQCSIGCTYCILKSYLNQPNLRLFGNTYDMLEEVDKTLNSYPNTLFRIGTGEFTDSLLLDPWTGLSDILVPFFSRKSNAVLELKTKTVNIGRLRKLNHGGHTIVGWSLNAPSIVSREERKSAPLIDRMMAARECARYGYFLAFHFDPLFYFPGWEEEYGRVIEMIGETVPTDRIVYVSLGAFRFMPLLKEIILRKQPGWELISGEFVPSPDGKRRYFRDIRVRLYSFMASRLWAINPSLCIYLCMESGSVWKDSLGFHPTELGGLPDMLDSAVKNRMGIGCHCTKTAAQVFLKKPQPIDSPWVRSFSKTIRHL